MGNPTLLAAVLANPADDAPRLIYAKWLKINGDPDRAEFIKVQCDRAAKDPFDPAQERLEKKEQSLLKKHQEEWLAELPEWARTGAKFRRGFVGVVAVDLATFAKRAAELVKVTPVDGIELSSGGADVRGVQALAKCPQAAQITELSLWYNEVGDAGAKAIASSPLFTGLKTLRLGVVGVTDEGVQALAASPQLAGLTELNVGGNTITLAGVQALASSPWKLATLALDNIPLTGKPMAALAAWPGLAAVRDLSLENAGIGQADAAALAASPHLTNLRALEIGSNPLAASGVTALADSSTLGNLVELHMAACGLQDDSLPALLRFKGLRKLTVVNNKFGEATRQAILKQFGKVASA